MRISDFVPIVHGLIRRIPLAADSVPVVSEQQVDSVLAKAVPEQQVDSVLVQAVPKQQADSFGPQPDDQTAASDCHR